MEDIIGITITDVFATTERMILCLSDDAEPDNIRNEVWKNPQNYWLARIEGGGTRVEIPLDDKTISYTNEIPAVIFLVENVVGDQLHLVCKHLDQEWKVVVGMIPIPEEKGTCDEVLELISDIPEKVTTIDEAVRKLTDENIPAIEELLGELVDKINARRPGVLNAIEDQLEESRKAVTEFEAEGRLLVNEVLAQWQAVLAEVEDALVDPTVQTDVKEKVKELQNFVGARVSEIGNWQRRINDPLIGARVRNIRKNTIASMNEALAFTSSIGTSMN